MEQYDIKNHLFYDGYNLDERDLKDIQYIEDLLKKVKKNIFADKGNITIIPYFDGRVKLDGGISGIILGNNFHFTCHTFCFKQTVFIDYYGDDNKKELLLNIILDTFKTNDYDLGSKNTKGNFGKHIIINSDLISFDEAIKVVNTILEKIQMTPISDLLINKIDEKCFDIIQPIAESHISLHEHNNTLIIDVFSCKNFDIEKLLSLFNNINRIEEVNRGIHYK